MHRKPAGSPDWRCPQKACRTVLERMKGKTVGKRKPQSDRMGPEEPLDRAAVEASRSNPAGEYSAWESGPDPQWVEFAGTYKGSAILRQDTICALPEPLIDAL